MAFWLPPPSRVRTPVKAAELANVYVPGARTRPPRFCRVSIVPAGWAKAALYAAIASFLAVSAVASAMCCTPFKTPGGNPVTDVPGERPKSPFTTDRPVLVTEEVAIMAYVLADPRLCAMAMSRMTRKQVKALRNMMS